MNLNSSPICNTPSMTLFLDSGISTKLYFYYIENIY